MNKQKYYSPLNEAEKITKKLVFFLHGWGSDGKDPIQISHHWKLELQNTTFFAPDGPEICVGNPNKTMFNICDEDN